MPESPAKSVLFVCSQNRCRSIAAETVFRYIVESTELKVEVDSAGVHASSGSPPYPELCAAAELRGYDPRGLRSRPVEADDFTRFDLILAADKGQLHALREMRARAPTEAGARIGLLLEYSRAFDAEEVLFPSDSKGYGEMLDLIEDACLGLYKTLVK